MVMGRLVRTEMVDGITGVAEMTEWMDIETAPKDRPILVYGNKEKGDQAEFSQRIAVAVYHSEMHYTYGDRPMFVYAPYRVEGDGLDRCICPSHWMELPEEPK
jgi:hypothetical protein